MNTRSSASLCCAPCSCLAARPREPLAGLPVGTIPAAGDERPVLAEERAEARRLGDAIDSTASARVAIQAWATIAAAQPADPEAWIEIACLRVLEGAAYRQRSKERLVCYVAGLRACERAMATNPEFLRRVQAGQTTWEAAAALGPREIGAMNLWSTGIFYIFRDCLGLFGRIVNVRRMDDAKALLLRMDAIDPAWEEHTTTFSWGIYYLAMPSSRGGDKARARECFDRAVALANTGCCRAGGGQVLLPGGWRKDGGAQRP